MHITIAMMVDDAADAYLCEADGSRKIKVVHDEKTQTYCTESMRNPEAKGLYHLSPPPYPPPPDNRR